MSGVVFKTIAVLVNKFEGELEEYILKENNYRVDSRTKFHSVLMNHCKEIYNFSLNFSLTDSWGFKLANGSFDGMTGALQRKEVDFGGSVLFLKKDRVYVISHGRSTWLLRYEIISYNICKL
ncbi:uncharacterized protein LOC108743369 [Agrilus planipennis]|uniref:Uncharacterized protein LOC108743369 n=1 Tax=Agrilus planipennis TaxID=224129 RepID=A0A1W4XNS6_AGRPL|nr:uncharacterized protein LOC108743369 [Agrilus planipennis]